MDIRDAQKEMRTVFLGGSVGQAVSGLIWLISAAVATWVSVNLAIIILAVGGAFIYPLTRLGLILLGQRGSLSRENALSQLAMQVAFTVPLALPVIGAAALYNINWFYPAFMIIVGAHYLPFMFLYGMQHYVILAAALIGGGFIIGRFMPENFVLGGWFTAVVLIGFAFLAWRVWAGESKGQRADNRRQMTEDIS
ncbi:MAG: hypothetical protein EHM41_26515 [Chloroflexi bacterium]|nr:MAG: hypothetical protein EHM41_26515 [Chloroflexota bacterium]